MRCVRVMLAALLVGGAIFSCGFAQETSREDEAFFVAKKAYADGFYDVSVELIDRFLKNYPSSLKSVDATLLKGQSLFHQGKYLSNPRICISLLTILTLLTAFLHPHTS